jgi:hypothetical protein
MTINVSTEKEMHGPWLNGGDALPLPQILEIQRHIAISQYVCKHLQCHDSDSCTVIIVIGNPTKIVDYFIPRPIEWASMTTSMQSSFENTARYHTADVSALKLCYIQDVTAMANYET